MLLKNLFDNETTDLALLLRLPVGRGGVLNSPRFCFFFDVESRATAHG